MTSEGHAAAQVLRVEQVARQPIDVVLSSTLAFGRDCDGFLLADHQASRRHVEFRLIDGRVTASDLGSSNGSMLDGRSLTGEMFVDVGSTVSIGATRITVLGVLAPLPAAAPSAERPKSSIMLVTDAVAAGEALDELAGEVRGQATFTIVFSDIEGSTTYATSVGDDAWMKLLDRHNALIRRELLAHDGREVKNQGDGFMMSFGSARSAVAFSIAVQRQLERDRASDPTYDVRVRLGIHTGEAISTAEGDLFGRHVIIASRIADQADGGEILVSALVRELTSGTMDFVFEDATTLNLKGIGEQLAHRVRWSDTPT